MTVGIIFLIILAIVFVYVIMTYNTLVAEIETIKNSEKQIDVQLDRRSKVFDSLVNVVKKYMDYEQSTLKQVVELRNKANLAKESGNLQERINAENKISELVKGINIQFENYPELKSNQNVIQLQEEITSTENKLAFAKQSFNDAIERYNAHKKSFFARIVASIFKNLDEDFVYWNISDEKKQQLEDARVEL
ncbi:MAG: LemA family protein [Francisella sp.]